MNIIGLMVPKIISLLSILITSINASNKTILVLIWFVKLMIDYDVARPGHSGSFYRLIKELEFEVKEVIVASVQFILSAIFLVATILMKAWIPFVPGIFGVLISAMSIIGCIKDINGKS